MTSEEPPRPRRLHPRLPRDLEAITLHCLEKEPSRRYPSALALAEDLQRFRGTEGAPGATRRSGQGRAAGPHVPAADRLVAALFVLLVFSLIGGLSGGDLEMAGSERPRPADGVTRNRLPYTRPTGHPWPPPARHWRTPTWTPLPATSSQRRSPCRIGNGGT